MTTGATRRCGTRVNPGLKHGYPDLKGLRQRRARRGEPPADREDFRQFNLNIWLDHSTEAFRRDGRL